MRSRLTAIQPYCQRTRVSFCALLRRAFAFSIALYHRMEKRFLSAALVLFALKIKILIADFDSDQRLSGCHKTNSFTAAALNVLIEFMIQAIALRSLGISAEARDSLVYGHRSCSYAISRLS